MIFLKKRMVHDLENSAQAISVMAELYLETYMINLESQNAVLIKGDKEKQLFNFEVGKIQEGLDKYVAEECVDTYAEALGKFFDLSTLEERMQDNASIVFEYKSISNGWCLIRFFQLNQSKEATRYIIAVQDINEERKRLHLVEEQIRQNENRVMTQGNFMENTFYAMDEIVAGIRNISGQMATDLTEDAHKHMAQAVNNSIEHLHLLQNCIRDLYAMNANRFELKNEQYDIREMTEKIRGILLPFSFGRNYEFQIMVDESIPSQLRGDKERLMQILVVLLFSSMFVTEKGFVRLSVFGKQNGDKAELIFSVRDSAMGFSEEQVIEIQEVFKEYKLKPLDNAALVYLQIMNQILIKMKSEMKIVSVLGAGSEFYFSIEQEVVNE